MHKLQVNLLSRLKEKNGLSYAQLTRGYTDEDNINYHLRQLIKNNLVYKDEGFYFISAQGIKVLAVITDGIGKNSQPKIVYLGFICQVEDQVLLKAHPNSKEEFYNLPSGQPYFGEKIEAALTRIFYQNTGIKLSPQDFAFDPLHLKTVKTNKGVVLFDDAFLVYKVKSSSSQKEKMKLKNNWVWKDKKELENLNCWPEA